MGKKARSQPHLSFVLDNSVTMVWAFEDETDAYKPRPSLIVYPMSGRLCRDTGV